MLTLETNTCRLRDIQIKAFTTYSLTFVQLSCYPPHVNVYFVLVMQQFENVAIKLLKHGPINLSIIIQHAFSMELVAGKILKTYFPRSFINCTYWTYLHWKYFKRRSLAVIISTLYRIYRILIVHACISTRFESYTQFLSLYILLFKVSYKNTFLAV